MTAAAEREPRVGRRLREMVRAGLVGAGSVVGVLALGGSAWGTVPGALLGLLVVFTGEWALKHRAEHKRLKEVELTMQQEIARRELAEQQAQASARGMAVAYAWTEVFGGALSEAVSTGRVLPLEAIRARADVTMKARGLDSPPADPAQWPANPRFSGRS